MRSSWASAEFLRFMIIILGNSAPNSISFSNLIYDIDYTYNNCRSQCVSILSRLNWLDRKQFRIFMKDLIDNKSVQFLLSFFHSYLGFCSEMTNPFSPNPNVVQLSRKKSPSRGPDLSPLGYSNNFGETSGNDFLEA